MHSLCQVDMDELRMLLVHPDNADRVARVHLPKADKECKENYLRPIPPALCANS
jgi:hypothetical protein